MNPEFDHHHIRIHINKQDIPNEQDANSVAEEYGRAVGRLPYGARWNTKTVTIHGADKPWGGGNTDILIYTESYQIWNNQDISDETLVHEAGHTTLDIQIS